MRGIFVDIVGIVAGQARQYTNIAKPSAFAADEAIPAESYVVRDLES